jgi:hypothetical protein
MKSGPFAQPFLLSDVNKNTRRAFTLAEIIVSLTVCGLVVACTTTVVRQIMRVYFYDTARLKINADMRKLTRDMTTDAVYANYFVIYPSFSERTVSASLNGGTTSVDNFVASGGSGDFLVLVTAETNSSGVICVSKLTGYYRDPPDGLATTLGPVRKFSVAVSPPAATPIHELLDTLMPVAQAHRNGTVIPLALGQANGDLFHNFFGRCVMIKSKIVEMGVDGTQPNTSLDAPQATHTYNFTVSPRG